MLSKFETSFIDSLVITLIICFIIRVINIPLFSVPSDIYVFSTFINIDPLTNIFRFIFIIFISLTSYLLSYYNYFSITKILSNVKKEYINILVPLFVIILCTVLFTFYVFNNINSVFSYLTNSIGESEFFGYYPTLISKGYTNIFTVHGGIDLFIPYLSQYIFPYNKTIIITRIIVYKLLPTLNIFLLIIISYFICISKYNISRIFIFTIITLITFLLNNYYYITSFQDTVFLFNILILIVLYSFYSDNNIANYICYFTCGIICYASFYYTFDRAIYGLLTTITLLVMILFSKGTQYFIKNTIYFSSGFILSILFTIYMYDHNVVRANLANLIFLFEEGRYCCQSPFLDYAYGSGNLPLLTTISIFSFSLVLVIHCSVLTFNKICLNNYKTIICSSIPIITLIISQLLYYRIVVDATDVSHLLQSLLINIVLINYLFFYYFVKFNNAIKHTKYNWLMLSTIITLLFILFIDERYSNNKLQIGTFMKNYANVYDSMLFSNLLSPNDYQTLLTEINKSSCFYTLNYVLSWNYYFNKPHCTKYPYNFINLSKKSQLNAIRQLKESKPEIILYSSNNNRSKLQYGVSSNSMVYLIDNYILNNYKPFKEYGDHWFWQYNKSKYNIYKYPVENEFKINYEVMDIHFIKKIINFTGIRHYTKAENISDLPFKLHYNPKLKKYIGILITVGKSNAPIWAGPLNKVEDTIFMIPKNKLSNRENDISVFLISENNSLYLIDTFQINGVPNEPLKYIVYK